MKVYYYNEDKWTESGDLWQALSLDARMKRLRAVRENAPYVISFTGAGGKTSLIRRLACEGRERGLKVLVVTTTHMFRPKQYGVLTRSKGDVRRMLQNESIAVVGKEAGELKITFVGTWFYEQICPLADLVLVEADGSRRLPLKVPGVNEPVVPKNSHMVLSVLGLSALDQPAEKLCFRAEQAEEIMRAHGRPDYKDGGQWIVRPGDVACLMQHAYLYPLRVRYPSIPVIPMFNQADEPVQVQTVRGLLDAMGEKRGIACGQLRFDPCVDLF